ncbi:MAG: energy transducer TonB [Gammaproteobacteria bacterium]|nr:energy transducer TonB [Gammaproteobacteria bacterium]
MKRFAPCVAALLLAAVPALAKYGLSLPRPPQPPVTSAEEIDAAIDQLHRFDWTLYANIEQLPESHARGAARELETHLLSAPVQARLASLAARVRGQDAREAARALEEARRCVTHEIYLVGVLQHFVSLTLLLQPHEARIEAVGAALAPTDRDRARERLNGERAALENAVRRALDVEGDAAEREVGEQLIQRSVQVIDAYNEVGEQLAELAGQARIAHGDLALPRPRASACPAPVAETSGRAVPALAPGNEAAETWYPPAIKRADLEGTVILEAHVSASGCAESVAIYRSSGIPELDEAGQAWAEQARYRPAEQDGRPAPGLMRMKIKFRMD